jgi:hypothetical protein
MSRGGEHPAQDRGDLLRFLIDLLFAQSLHLESKRAQLEISSPVVAMCLLAAVIPVAVGFDYEPEVWPDEIRLVFANLNVDLGHGQPVAPADPQKGALEVTAGAVVVNVLTERQAEHLGLPNHPPHLGLRDSSMEIGDRRRRPGDGDSMTPSDVCRRKRFAAMQTDSRSPRPASIPADRDMGRSICRLQQLPQLGGAPVTDDRIVPKGESCRHPYAMPGDPRVPHGIYAAVNAMQMTSVHAASHARPAQANFLELSR